MNKNGKLFVISGSSGVGKGTLLKLFLDKHADFKLSVSCTTRTPREGEEHGKNYFFVSREEFEFNPQMELSSNFLMTSKNSSEVCTNPIFSYISRT